jgi:hypothetical protein
VLHTHVALLSLYVCGNDDNIQVERSDGLEYVAGTFVWSGYDYFGESRGYPQTVKCRGAVAVRNAEGETKRTLCCCCCSQAICLVCVCFCPEPVMASVVLRFVWIFD